MRFSSSSVQDITLVHFVDQHHRAAPFCFILSRSELLHRCTPSHATRPYYLLYQPFSSNHSWKPPLLNICSSSWLSLLESSSRQVGTLLVWTKQKESQAILFLCFDNSSLIMVIPFLHVDQTFTSKNCHDLFPSVFPCGKAMPLMVLHTTSTMSVYTILVRDIVL